MATQQEILDIVIRAEKSVAELRRLSEAEDLAGRHAAQAQKRIRAFRLSVASIPGSIRVARFALSTLFIGLATGAVVRKVIGVFSDFEDALVRVQGITKATKEEFDLLSQSAEHLGVVSLFTSAQVAKSEVNIARAGFTAGETVNILENSLDLATVAQVQTETSARILTNTLRQFNIVASESAHVVDVLTEVSNSANTTVEELAQGMKFAGTAVASVKGGLEEASAALGALADRGLQATKGGTILRQSIIRLINPTTKAARTIRRMGLTLEEVNPEKVGIIRAFENLQRVHITLGEAARIFNSRTAVGALILARSVDQIRSLSDAARDADGATRELASAIEQTLGGRLKLLLGTIEAVVVKFGKSGAGKAFADFIAGLTDGIRVLAGINEGFLTTEENARKFAEGIETGLGIAATIALFKGLYFVIRVAKLEWLALGQAFKTNPIGLALAAIAAVVSVLIVFRKELFGVDGVFRPFIRKVKAGFTILKDAAKLWSSEAAKAFDVTFGGGALDAVKKGLSVLGQAVVQIGKLTLALFGLREGHYLEDLAVGFVTLVTHVNQLGAALIDFVVIVGKGLGGIATAFIQVLQLDFKGASATIKETGRQVAEQYTDGFTAALGRVGDSIVDAIRGGDKVAQDLKSIGKSHLTAYLEGYYDELDKQAEGLADVARGIAALGLSEGPPVLQEQARKSAERLRKERETLAKESAKVSPRLNEEDLQAIVDRITKYDEEVAKLGQKLRLKTRELELTRQGVKDAATQAKQEQAVNEALITGDLRLVALTAAKVDAERQLAEAKERVKAAAKLDEQIQSLREQNSELRIAIELTRQRSKVASTVAEKQVELGKAILSGDLRLIAVLAEQLGLVKELADERERAREADRVEERLNSVRTLNKELEEQLRLTRLGVKDAATLAKTTIEIQEARAAGNKELALALEKRLFLQNKLKELFDSERDRTALDSQIKRNEALRLTNAALREGRVINTDILNAQSALNLANAKGNTLLENRLAEYVKLLQTNQLLLQQQEKFADIQNVLTDGFTSFVEKLTEGTLTFKEAILDLAQTIERELLNRALKNFFTQFFRGGQGSGATAFLASAFGSSNVVASAHGNIFQDGTLIPFASGGIISRPTLFPLAGQKTGIAGEQGIEAIMPVTRTSGGDLGVKVVGNLEPQQVTVIQNISTPNADSFRRSKRQIQRDAQSVLIR